MGSCGILGSVKLIVKLCVINIERPQFKLESKKFLFVQNFCSFLFYNGTGICPQSSFYSRVSLLIEKRLLNSNFHERYTGFCPQYKYRIGDTYGTTTHKVLLDPTVHHAEKLVLSDRLADDYQVSVSANS